MASSSGAFSSVVAHGHHSISPLSIAHSMNGEIRCHDLTSWSDEVPEQPSCGNYPGLPAQLVHYTGPLIGAQNTNVIDSVQGQQIHGSAGARNESDPDTTGPGGEWLGYFGTPADTTPPDDITEDYHQTAEFLPFPSAPNSETWHPTVPPSVSIPSNPPQLYANVSSPAATNGHSPKRTRTRMRWTVEMHDRFIDAVNQLGGVESAKPKNIVEIMNVEGLTREHVKSHLQKYKSAQVRNQSSEGQLAKTGTSVEMTMSNEVVPSNVQMSIEALALRVQMEFQKKLHEMVEKTHHDLLEIQRSLLERHVMNLRELENRRNPSTGHTAPLPAGGSRGNHGVGSANAASDVDGHMRHRVAHSSHGDHAGA